LRFGLIEAGLLLFPAHEVGGHLEIPGALGFVENNYAITRGTKVSQAGVAEVMNVLDEGFDLLLHDAFSRF
jgi:hypothetical protein